MDIILFIEIDSVIGQFYDNLIKKNHISNSNKFYNLLYIKLCFNEHF